MRKSDLSKAAAALGRKGGKVGGLATGETKSRGDAAHYRDLAARSAASKRRSRLLREIEEYLAASSATPDDAFDAHLRRILAD